MPVFTDRAETLKEEKLLRRGTDLMVTELRKCFAFEANILQYDREDDKTRFECEDLILCFGWYEGSFCHVSPTQTLALKTLLRAHQSTIKRER